jgi:hypothetical protein
LTKVWSLCLGRERVSEGVSHRCARVGEVDEAKGGGSREGLQGSREKQVLI